MPEFPELGWNWRQEKEQKPKLLGPHIFWWGGGLPRERVPKGPARTKKTTESEFRYGEKIEYGRSKTLRTGLRSDCFIRQKRQENGTESEKLRRIRAPYYCQYGRVLWVGAKSSVRPLKLRESKRFGGISQDFFLDIPGVPEKIEKKMFVFKFRPLEVLKILKRFEVAAL